MNIKHLETKEVTIMSSTLNGFSVKVSLNHNNFIPGTTVQAGSSMIDFSKVTCKCILNRAGLQHILFQDNLKVLGLAANLNTRGSLAFYQDHDHYLKVGDGKSLVAFNIPLGGHLNLKGDDNIYLEVQALDGFLNSDYLNTSFLEIKEIKSVGYEEYVPSIKSMTIQAGDTANTYSLGDNINKCVILNYDHADFTSPVISAVDFTSDRLNTNLNYLDLVLAKNGSMGKQPVNQSLDESTVYEDDQCFTIVDFHQVFNAVQLNIAFDGVQVAASKNFIVYWSFKTDWTIINKANALASKHAQIAAAKIGA